MSHFTYTLALTLAVSGLSGCVLIESADSYPFSPIISFDPDSGTEDDRLVKDLPPVDPPLLVFTEILIDAPGTDPSVNERGEYVEVKNVGIGPADPRAITLFLRDIDNPLGGARINVQDGFGPEEMAVVNGLQMIQPGEYFIFVRHEDPTIAAISEQVEPGYIYDYGRYASGPTLPHQQGARRQLDLGYSFPNGDTIIFDGIRWEGHSLVDPDGVGEPQTFAEGEAIAVDEQFEHPDANNDPQNWCVPTESVGQVMGTPGRATTCG